MRDIIFVSENDWANNGAFSAAAGRRVGLDCLSVAHSHHVFDYPEKSNLWNSVEELQALTDQFKVVVIMHIVPFWPVGLILKKRDWQKWASQNSRTGISIEEGSSSARAVNPLFNKVIDTSLCCEAEIMDCGETNGVFFKTAPPDMDRLKPVFSDPEVIRKNGLKFRHKPRWDKGSSKIDGVMAKFAGRCSYYNNGEVLPWVESIKRMSDCDVYIEQLVYSWGLSAIEAAALGKVVVTSFRSLERYEREYNCKCELLVANTESELSSHVERLLASTPEEIIEKQKATRDWAERIHGYEASGRRLKELLL